MQITIDLQWHWWMALALGNAAVWGWAILTPAEPGGYIPDFAPAFRCMAALILTVALWVGYAAAHL